ncbi:MAG: glycosyltransferase [Paludibacteraceae bacterium]|nr:glycosyltransferase [Paludibacteraceae bacterium]
MRSSQQHICALIPTYNNAGTIVDVVRRVHKHLRNIIVVVDGSTDNTHALLDALEFPVAIVSHAKNRGKGAALVSGFRKAIELGYDFALTIDSDGQHYPEDIPILLRAHDIHPQALIVGSRQFTDANMPGKSKFANRFSNFWFALQTSIHLPDTQTGMRLYPLHRLHGLNILTRRYEAELELLVFAAWHNVPLVPVHVRVWYPPKEERVSHFVPIRDFTRISILNCFLCIGAVLFGYINMYWRTVLSFFYFGTTMLFVVNPITWIFFAIHGDNAGTRARYHKFAHWVAGHYVRMIGGLRPIIDTDQSPLTDRQAVIIANHQSFIDIILCLSLSPKIVMVVKDYVWYSPFLGVVARYLDCVPTSYDDERREATVKRIIEEGYSLFVFPEGTRTTTGEVGRFHRGAFYYAEHYHLPIQPLLIEGMTDYMGKRQFVLRPYDVRLSVLPLIPADDYSWGTTYKKRAKSLEMHYNALLHSNRVRVGILGAGVGGLFTGAMLAQRGYEVTLLEQLPVFGGGLYSYERNGETWGTGMHILSGMEPEGAVTKVLDELGIKADCVMTTLDNSPEELIGKAEWHESLNGVYRFVGGSQKLANELALAITRHGGRIITSEQVKEITQNDGLIVVNGTWRFHKLVSTLHPKQLLKLTNLPLYRPVTRKRIESTPETFGSFKTYIRLQPEALPYDHVTHYLPEHRLLIMTPCSEHGQIFARTIETIMPLNYGDLAPWHADRKENYTDYEAFKRKKEQEVLTLIETVYPDIRKQMVDIFSSTSLTFRDDYLSPEGAMFGMSEPIGSVRTHVNGFYLSGQNIFLHGLCGVVMTAKQTIDALCEDCD